MSMVPYEPAGLTCGEAADYGPRTDISDAASPIYRLLHRQRFCGVFCLLNN